jgi:hypothetical protein
MPDYQCWPIWHHGGEECGPIDPRELELSDALVADLLRWSEVYESHLNWSDPASTSWTKEEEAEFDRDGRKLCRRLATKIGDRFEIFYSSECIPVEALREEA